MATPETTTRNRHPGDIGSDLWVRASQPHRHPTAGRGLFAGLQDVKHYDVKDGWAKRKADESRKGLMGFLWNRVSGGAYRAPEHHEPKEQHGDH